MSNLETEAIIYIGLTLIVILIIWIIRIELRLKKMLRGESGSIEDALKSIDSELKKLNLFKSDIEKYLDTVEKRLKKSVQGLENVSFSAFKGLDSGGAQSFAIALLNESGDGVILSSLHSRDRVNVFSKTIKQFKSQLELTEEETDALTKAMKSCKL